jgi:hypothetical protein
MRKGGETISRASKEGLGRASEEINWMWYFRNNYHGVLTMICIANNNELHVNELLHEDGKARGEKSNTTSIMQSTPPLSFKNQRRETTHNK